MAAINGTNAGRDDVHEDTRAAHVVAAMIDHIVARAGARAEDGLEALAVRAGYEAHYFQKLFTRYVGVSPKNFQRYMAYTKARSLLLKGMPTLEAAYEAGLSGNGRLHDLFVTIEAATPGEVASGGRGLDIHYGCVPTPVGYLVLGQTARGVCWAGFQVDETPDLSVARMTRHWPNARMIEDVAAVEDSARAIMAIWGGVDAGGGADEHAKPQVYSGAPLALHLKGTNFQMQVWRALLKIPSGVVVSYEALGEALGRPKSARAIGNAVGSNPVSLLIPCHRVIQKSGVVNNYGWGSPRKKTLLGLEGRGHCHNNF